MAEELYNIVKEPIEVLNKLSHEVVLRGMYDYEA